jgi:hypothetical protein
LAHEQQISRQISGTTRQNFMKLGRKHPWKVIYKECSFSSDPSINMTATGHSCFWFLNIFFFVTV